jgi:nucleotide-binding universal stress UspA family protein
MIRRIVLATDFSDHSGAAGEHAVLLARLFSAEIELYSSCFVSPLALGSTAFSLPPAFFEDLENDTRARLEAEAARLRDAGIRTRIWVDREEPSTGIAARAKDSPADLLVLGTRGLSGLKHVLLGSVAERVARSSPCPVLTAHADHLAPQRYARIAVATDFSTASNSALAAARTLARQGESSLLLLHCVDPGFGASEEAAEEDARTSAKIESARARLAALAQPGEAVDVIAGHLHGAGLEWIEKQRVDLVAVGTRGRTGLPQVLLGSNAERVMRGSPVPVLTVHTTPEPTPVRDELPAAGVLQPAS